MPFAFQAAARRPGRPTDECGHTMRARSQQHGGFKGEGVYSSSATTAS
ncbi:hypothetical protein RINTU1_33840 [Candidatus Regiella insecticola]|uniref:Uncharacterized protein n=1 Tax=Candidatus Regiella insecticola TaxID=138073 RepID=A0A6L2ZR55_9ENTR|nr:hypothetical protein RINTU1_33840 [Candidatus Regiella insecticola]